MDMKNKYNLNFNDTAISGNKIRLINQLWKVLPMRENDEEWEKQVDIVINDLIGLNEVLYLGSDYLLLLSKLEFLKKSQDFISFRKTVFESISLLDKVLIANE